MPRGLVAIPFICRRLYRLARDYNVRACSDSLAVSSSSTAGLEAKLTIEVPHLVLSRNVDTVGRLNI